jgi:hypothetical protein
MRRHCWVEVCLLRENMLLIQFLIKNKSISLNIISNMWSNYSEASKSAAREMINAKPTAETYKRTLNIDTRFRENYYKTNSTDFHVSLPVRIKGVTKMKLCSLELPFTIYNISASQGNNVFYVGTALPLTTITLPDGNYTVDMLQTELNAQLGANYEAIIDKRTKRVVISRTNDTAIILKFTTDSNTNLQQTLGWMLGFRFGQYEGNTSYVSEAPYILKSPRYIFLRIDDYNNTSNESIIGAFNSSITTNNILAKISNGEYVPDENIFLMTLEDKYISGCKERTYSGPVDIEKLRIQLIDDFGRIVNLNGSDFSFSLEFECN